MHTALIHGHLLEGSHGHHLSTQYRWLPTNLGLALRKVMATNGGISDSPITSFSTLEIGYKILV